MSTMYGQPGLLYAPLGGSSYLSDGKGRIANVADKDTSDLRRMGCLDEISWLSAGSGGRSVLTLLGVPISGNGGSYAGFAPPGVLLVNDEPALYQNIGSIDSPIWMPVGGSGGLNLIGSLPAADMNSTDDQEFTLLPSASGQFRARLITATNATGTLDMATGGIYTAASKGGTAIVASSQDYSALTDPTISLDLAIVATPQNTFWPDGTTLFLSLTTPQGVAAIADFYIYGVN